MTTVPVDPHMLELLDRHREEQTAHAKAVLDKVGQIGAWLSRKATDRTLTPEQIDQAVADLQQARPVLYGALRDARCYEQMSMAMGGAQPSPIEEAARAAVSQPLTPVPDGPGPDRTDTEQPAPDRTTPDGPGHARTPAGRIVAAKGAGPVDADPKGGAK